MERNLSGIRSIFQDLGKDPGGGQVLADLSSAINKNRAQVDEGLTNLVKK